MSAITGSGKESRYPIAPESLRVFPTDADLPADELNTSIDRHFVPVAHPAPPGQGGFEAWKAGLWAEGAGGDYAGDATCRRCHAPAFGDLGDTNHRPRPADADDPPHRGCEGCHGPGAAHAASGGVSGGCGASS